MNKVEKRLAKVFLNSFSVLMLDAVALLCFIDLIGVNLSIMTIALILIVKNGDLKWTYDGFVDRTLE